MIGVSGPLNAEDPRGATRFVTGLAIGAATTTLVLGTVAAVVAALLVPVPGVVRITVAIAGLLVLGLLDLANRTLELRRQVPQRFARVLDPGARGLLWGADLATLVSTRKTTSLPWVALAVVPLLGRPAIAAAVIATANLVFVAGIAMQTKIEHANMLRGRFGAINIGQEIGLVRRLAGLLLLCCAGLLAVWGLR